jgi:hypothetical protein
MPYVRYAAREEKGTITMTENVRKFEKALREDEELRARFAAEFKRIAEEKSALNDIEAYVKAAKAVGFELSLT